MLPSNYVRILHAKLAYKAHLLTISLLPVLLFSRVFGLKFHQVLVGIFDPNLRGLRFPFGLITLYYTIMDLIVGWYVVIWTHVMWFRRKTQKSVINRACKVDITFCIWNAPLAYLVVAIQAKNMSTGILHCKVTRW